MSKIIRSRTQIDGYIGAYSHENNVKPSYCVEIYKKTFFGKKLLRRYYTIFHVFRTIGFKEPHLGLPSVAKEYGDVIECGYRYMTELKDKSLKRIYGSFVLC